MVENWLPKPGPAGSAEAHGARIRPRRAYRASTAVRFSAQQGPAIRLNSGRRQAARMTPDTRGLSIDLLRP